MVEEVHLDTEVQRLAPPTDLVGQRTVAVERKLDYHRTVVGRLVSQSRVVVVEEKAMAVAGMEAVDRTVGGTVGNLDFQEDRSYDRAEAHSRVNQPLSFVSTFRCMSGIANTYIDARTLLAIRATVWSVIATPHVGRFFCCLLGFVLC